MLRLADEGLVTPRRNDVRHVRSVAGRPIPGRPRFAASAAARWISTGG